MNTPNDLLARARRALESTAVATLALAPLALQPAQATVFTPGDLTVQRSGAYFYNASGYFADWRGQPVGDAQSATNPDGSTKFFGNATASPELFMAHNCYTDPYPNCNYYQDRGIAMVWSGSLSATAQAGDRLAMSVDFTVTLPDVGGQWAIGARLGDYNFSNTNSLPSYGSSSDYGWQGEAGSYRVQGNLLSDALEDWQVVPGEPIYWQVFVAGVADAPWSETYWSDLFGYVTPYRSVTITVPEHSIDIAHVDASYTPGSLGLSVTAVPEPGTWLLMALGLGLLGVRARRG